MRTLCLVLAAVTGTALPAGLASYNPYEPFELALQADLIVDAVVVDFDRARPTRWDRDEEPATLTLEVREVIAGGAPEGPLVVEAFYNWTCHARYAPYAKGQHAVFFLQYGSEKGKVRGDRPPQVLGAGNEGECPIVGEHVFHRGHRLRGRWGAKKTWTKVEAFGHEYYAIRSPRKEYFAAVRGVRKCFRWRGVPGEACVEFPIERLRRTCTDEELEEFIESSQLARAFVRDTRNLDLQMD